MNNKGYVVITVVMILFILTATGVLCLKRAMRETKDAAQFQFKTMGFYAAESGISHAVIEAKVLALADYFTEPATYVDFVSGDTGQLTTYAADLTVLDTFELTRNIRDVRVKSRGQQVKGVYSIVEAEFRFYPPFQTPGAPIRTKDELVKIQGSPFIDSDYNLCDGESTPPEVLYDIAAVGTDTYFAKESICDDLPCQSEAAEPEDIILWAELKTEVLKITAPRADLPDYIGTEDDPQVVFIDATSDPYELHGETGYGILFIDGNVSTISGNFEWYGVVIISGRILNKITGNVSIYGSLMMGGFDSTIDDDDELWGNLSVYYDCPRVSSLYDRFARYRLKWWREQLPKMTLMPNGTIIRR